jgi:tetratricopeptide (TPR) repeat protein
MAPHRRVAEQSHSRCTRLFIFVLASGLLLKQGLGSEAWQPVRVPVAGVMAASTTDYSRMESIGDKWDDELERGKALAGQGRYEEALRVFEKLIDSAEGLGPTDTRLAITLNNAGAAYWHLKDSHHAESCYLRSVEIWQAARGPSDPNLVVPLTNLSNVYLARGQFTRSEAAAGKALDLAGASLGPDHPVTAAILSSLATLRFYQGDFEDAAERAKGALAILRERGPRPEHATALGNLGVIYQAQGRVDKATPLFAEAIEVLAQANLPEHPAWIRALRNQSFVHAQAGNWRQAELELVRALDLARKVVPPKHPETAVVLRAYAALLRKTHRKTEAKKLEAKAAGIEADADRRNTLGYTIDVHRLKDSGRRLPTPPSARPADPLPPPAAQADSTPPSQ